MAIQNIIKGRSIKKFGHNPDLDMATPTPEDIIGAGGLQYWPAAAVAAADIDIASSSVEDDPDKGAGVPGTGAHVIVIEGLDANYQEITEEVTLNGTADVHPTKDYLRIHRVYVKTVGTGGINAGNIQIDDGAGNVLAYVLANFGQTTQAAYTIPAYDVDGRPISKGWLANYHVDVVSQTAVYISFKLFVREPGYGWRAIDVFGATDGRDHEVQDEIPNSFPPGTDIRMHAYNGNKDNVAASANFEIYLEP